jgi:hypothetical protein
MKREYRENLTSKALVKFFDQFGEGDPSAEPSKNEEMIGYPTRPEAVGTPAAFLLAPMTGFAPAGRFSRACDG